MKISILIISCLISSAALCQNFDSLRIDLEMMMNQNMELRQRVMPIVKQYGFKSPEMDSLNRLIMAFDSINLIKVSTIIDSYGWLGKSKIGEHANEMLFVTIQHSPLQTIEYYYPLLKQSAEAGESSMANMATMYDRIQVDKGLKQLYGTQFKMVDGQLTMYPVEDIKNLNERRKSVGLNEVDN